MRSHFRAFQEHPEINKKELNITMTLLVLTMRNLEDFERELKGVLDEKFMNRLINLKKTGNIFSPMFYLIFTRLVELSSVLNDIVLPNRIELVEMFRTRKEFLQIDYNTINEFIRRLWYFESKREKGYSFSQSLEDFMYIVYRMKDVQNKIDQVILKNIRKWEKDEIAKMYFIMIKTFIEIDEEANNTVNESLRLEIFKNIILNLFTKKEEVEELISVESESEMLNIFKAILEGDYSDERVSKLKDLIDNLTVSERLAIMKTIEAFLNYNK
ncbi:hypothetical protein Asulf_00325 [Archaeoglobus sulfaticallidus PM70-1]|uniref:Uncharacterized protein n=1 Tax=Archaeoglobus sulfaticallidus PM70-1 TaxID=387631 RepID=N0BDN5_9EURY|nr:hypothetical protein [Archaeoglobus sulfaticallidus]AGK60357.1 hypothetical protein Asulf_00325 [Archaeoglobus sulfaticallidus PM70-1]